MLILGISAFYHDSAAAIIRDGDIVAAAQEERFTRKKHDPSFPAYALQYCLNEAGVVLEQVDYVGFYDKPFLKFERLLETYLAFAPRGFQSFSKAIPIWLREKLFLKDLISKELQKIGPNFKWESKLLFGEHHQSHAASAYFPSPYDEAVVLTMDGVGEWATTSVGVGRGSMLEINREIHFPHSLGLLYSAFTYYLGFKVNSGEYKVMGLAPYGEPRYVTQIYENLIDIKADGSYRLNLKYFNYAVGLTMTSSAFDDLFGAPRRTPDEQLTQRHMDLAASLQAVTEEVVLRMTRALAKSTGIRNLCMAGGVALNCVANGKVLRDGYFDNIWVQPAAGDAGGALGVALAAHYGLCGAHRASRTRDEMKGGYLGPEFTQAEIESRLAAQGAVYSVVSDSELFGQCAAHLADGQAVGWFQGRMEFGPRALGGRSILGDPRSPDMQKNLNLKVKFRESFRPFAPSVLSEHASDWFDIQTESPYMLMVADIAKNHQRVMTAEESALFGVDKLNVVRSDIPAVTHVDYSARIQTVHKETNPRYHSLISAFHSRTGCPVLVNTSFNVRGEPIVGSPEDAFNCFMGTNIEILAVGNCLLEKSKQTVQKKSYANQFELD